MNVIWLNFLHVIPNTFIEKRTFFDFKLLSTNIGGIVLNVKPTGLQSVGI